MHTPIFAFDLMGDKTQNIALAKNDFLNLQVKHCRLGAQERVYNRKKGAKETILPKNNENTLIGTTFVEEENVWSLFSSLVIWLIPSQRYFTYKYQIKKLQGKKVLVNDHFFHAPIW